jgi:hypothetical protein
MNSSVIIPLCRHVFSDGLRCRGAAVRGRSCCRHHLTARSRLHNMARARRRILLPRFVVPESPRDLAYNRAEVHRLLGTRGVDPDTAKTMLWALRLCAAALPTERDAGPPHAALGRRSPNVFYHVPASLVLPRSSIQNRSQALENTMRGERVQRHRQRPR